MGHITQWDMLIQVDIILLDRYWSYKSYGALFSTHNEFTFIQHFLIIIGDEIMKKCFLVTGTVSGSLDLLFSINNTNNIMIIIKGIVSETTIKYFFSVSL